jgi:hypothetical protein
MTARNRAAHPLKAMATSQRLRLGPKNLSLLDAAMKNVTRPFRENMSARSWAAPSHGRIPNMHGPRTTKRPIQSWSTNPLITRRERSSSEAPGGTNENLKSGDILTNLSVERTFQNSSLMATTYAQMRSLEFAPSSVNKLWRSTPSKIAKSYILWALYILDGGLLWKFNT